MSCLQTFGLDSDFVFGCPSIHPSFRPMPIERALAEILNDCGAPAALTQFLDTEGLTTCALSKMFQASCILPPLQSRQLRPAKATKGSHHCKSQLTPQTGCLPRVQQICRQNGLDVTSQAGNTGLCDCNHTPWVIQHPSHPQGIKLGCSGRRALLGVQLQTEEVDQLQPSLSPAFCWKSRLHAVDVIHIVQDQQS